MGAATTEEAIWHIYIIQSADGRFYTGISTDPERRLIEHRQGGARSAKALRGKGPLEMVFCQQIGDRSQALRAEYQLKQFSRAEKIKIIARGEFVYDGL